MSGVGSVVNDRITVYAPRHDEAMTFPISMTTEEIRSSLDGMGYLYMKKANAEVSADGKVIRFKEVRASSKKRKAVVKHTAEVVVKAGHTEEGLITQLENFMALSYEERDTILRLAGKVSVKFLKALIELDL
jgi:hypothetical protein